MLKRPLIPVLFFLITGILIGRVFLPYHQIVSSVFVCLIISFLVFSLFISPEKRQYLFLILFLFTGILLELNTVIHSELLPLAEERARVTMEGVVLQPGKRSGQTIRYNIRATQLFRQGSVTPLDEKIRLTIYNYPTEFSPGQKIRFPAHLRLFINFHNPGSYDYERSMELNGFTCAASVSDGRYVVVMGNGNLSFLNNLLEKIRKPVRQQSKTRLSQENNALFKALILGEKDMIDTDLRDLFNLTGLGHILAVSGLHIGLIAYISFFLIEKLLSFSYRLTLSINIRKVAAIITCFPVVAYTFLAGFQVSSQRAMIMGILFLFSIVLDRGKEVWSTLALAAIIILAIDPNSIFGISFQLSFVAVTGIIWLTPAIYKQFPEKLFSRLPNLIYHLFNYFLGLIVVTACALIFLLPMTSFYFNVISIVSIPANILILPLLGVWILPLGLLSAVSLIIFPPLSGFMLTALSMGLNLMMDIVRFWAQFDWGSFLTVTPSYLEIILFYSILFFIFFIRRGNWAKIGLILLVMISISDISYWIINTQFNKGIEVTFLDVGQGNSALIRFPGNKRMLIDGGGFGNSSFDTGRSVVAPFLLYSKILRVDYLVLSHPHPDHMNGLPYIASNFSPKEFWYNGQSVETPTFNQLMDIVKTRQIRTVLPTGLREAREVSGVKVELLHPFTDKYQGVSPDSHMLNNNSLVIKMSYGDRSLLFPGDLETEGERDIVSNVGNSLNSDILLASHHGSKYSCTLPFLSMVTPEICVISAGKDNYFGFPHENTLERLKKTGCRVMRIDEMGAVKISVNKDELKINSYFN